MGRRLRLDSQKVLQEKENSIQQKDEAIQSLNKLQAEINILKTSMSDTQRLVVTKEKDCKELEREYKRYRSEKDKALKDSIRKSQLLEEEISDFRASMKETKKRLENE